MSDSHLAGAYWGCREESAEACASRAASFFQLLADCHPSYARWYEQARSPKQALQQRFEPTRDAFLRFFGQGKYQNDGDGFHFSAWTGHERQSGEGGVVMLHCGSTATGGPNSVRLSFPKDAPGVEPLLTAAVAERVLKALARAWEPEWALVTGDGLWEEFSRHDEADTFLGWMTYLPRLREGLPSLPEPVRIESVGDTGSLIVLAPERFTRNDSERVALGHQVQRLLEERGFLGKMTATDAGIA
ncbi:Imm52 family immunity protein [Archangium primigenium]|uniref:Imm52 family immunity protein n=1 Tax=[Archangium] primigenium TaxID=2792470 RepID=UPI00195BAC53|nr:Imm52 family immunity protein [Archangium primigenium]MBM7112247.1 immunity 52 family protein [Archangium primigenium]